ncbi:MAG: FkbM family methyltransferase [Verrucomicrobia bacterium]|nr:FkbM family methyltransferase [Verrucomicrobiota bacterium]
MSLIELYKEIAETQNKVVRTRYGDMIINKHDHVIGSSLELYGEWAQLEIDLLNQFIPKGGVCIDVGANFGYHTLAFARAVGKYGYVISFEPQHCIFQILAGNVALNHHEHVWTYACAVSNHIEKTAVPRLTYQRRNSFGGLSLKKDWAASGPSYYVPTVVLDSCRLPRLDLIKIDAEGGEIEVIEGAVHSIAEHKPIIYVEDSGPQLVELIRSLDYEIYDFSCKYFNPNNFNFNEANVFRDLSDGAFLCLHKSREYPVDLEALSINKH